MLSTGGSRTPATYKMELFVRIFLFILLTASIVPNVTFCPLEFLSNENKDVIIKEPEDLRQENTGKKESHWQGRKK